MIDHLMALDPGGRGIAAFFVRGGATAAARTLRRSRRVLLTTGFAVGPGLPETDGPPATPRLGPAVRARGPRGGRSFPCRTAAAPARRGKPRGGSSTSRSLRTWWRASGPAGPAADTT